MKEVDLARAGLAQVEVEGKICITTLNAEDINLLPEAFPVCVEKGQIIINEGSLTPEQQEIALRHAKDLVNGMWQKS